MQYQSVTEDSFAKDNVKLAILPFLCMRGRVPLAENKHCSNMLTLSLTKKKNPEQTVAAEEKY